ncbi:MAG: shikimate dehydrogenase [Anaerolineae bacterium]|nr:shikimate dehydrogenase [Anaerolineae bacterium]
MQERQTHSGPVFPILGSTCVVGVIGWPVEHSVSPPMHNAAFRALGLPWCYVPLPVRPARVSEAVLGARALGLKGLNVTVPHKQAVYALLDELSPAARAIGAVNTITFEDDRILGHNTDVGGFLRALREAGFEPQGCSALVLGAGGAARAVVYALGSVGAQVAILNRTLGRAVELARELSQALPEARFAAYPLNESHLGQYSAEVQLVINATPLGMWPQVDASPWPEAMPFPSEAFCFDLIYNPRETQLMRHARAAGARAADGLGMLVHQGAEAFECWTGARAPVEVMYAACTAVLGGK